MAQTQRKKLILAITGASGVTFGLRALALLKDADVEVHLMISKAGERTIAEEVGADIKAVRAMADHVYPVADIGAAPASGSADFDAMLVLPCTIKTMSEINSGVTSNLISRAADVCLKERRPLVLMVRETPLHTGHLRTMTSLSEIGAIIMPPNPAFYAKPESLEDMVDQLVARALSLVGIDVPLLRRWKS